MRELILTALCVWNIVFVPGAHRPGVCELPQHGTFPICIRVADGWLVIEQKCKWARVSMDSATR